MPDGRRRKNRPRKRGRGTKPAMRYASGEIARFGDVVETSDGQDFVIFVDEAGFVSTAGGTKDIAPAFSLVRRETPKATGSTDPQ